MKRKRQAGCRCGCTCHATVIVHLRGCNSDKVEGGTVTIGDDTVDVDSYSDATFSLEPGTYTASGSGPGYTTSTTTFTVPSGCADTAATVNLSPDSDHVCCTCCAYSIRRKTAYLTDANGTWTGTSNGPCEWLFEATVTKHVGVVSWIVCDDGGLPPVVCYQPRLDCAGTDTLHYLYILRCEGGVWKMSGAAAAYIGYASSHGCDYSGPEDFCYANDPIPSSPGSVCPSHAGDVRTTTGAEFFNLTMTVDTACAIEEFALSATLPSWGSTPSDGPPATGDITVTF